MTKVTWDFSIDMEAPTFTICPGNQTLGTALNQPTAVAVWDEPKYSDNSGSSPTLTCSRESGSQFGIGSIEVVCEATDESGNKATCVFNIAVIGK